MKSNQGLRPVDNYLLHFVKDKIPENSNVLGYAVVDEETLRIWVAKDGLKTGILVKAPFGV